MAATTLYQYYTSQGKTLPNITDRAKIYESSGLGAASTYGGTAEQNTALLNKLQGSTQTPTKDSGLIFGERKLTTTLNGKTYDQYGDPFTAPASTISNAPNGPVTTKQDSAQTGSVVGTSDAVTNAEKAAAEKKLQDEIAEQTRLAADTAKANLDKIKAEITPAGGKPAAPKLIEEYQKLRDEGGVVKIEDELTAIRTEKDELLAQFSAFKRKEPTGVTAGFAQGRISEEAQNVQDRIDFLTRQENAKVEQLNNKNKYIETVMNLTGDDYDNAVKRYDTEFSQNIQMQTALNQYKTTQAAEENRLRDDARAYLTSVGNLVKDSGKSWDDIDSAMKADIRAAELRAGFAPGTLEAFARSKPKAALLGSRDGYDQSGAAITTLIYDDGLGGIKTTIVKTGGTKTSDSAVTKEFTVAGIQSLLAQDPNTTRADLEAQIDAETDLTKESINELLNAAGAYEFVPQANLSNVSNAFVTQIKSSGAGLFKTRSAERDRLTAIVQSGVVPLKDTSGKETFFRLTTAQQEQILSDIESKT